MTESRGFRRVYPAIQAFMALIVLAISLYIGLWGYDYYQTPLEERFYHEQHEWFKASGLFGHGLGWAGTLMMATGVFLYIPAKKYGFLERFIRLKYLLDIHIFLCTLGPILILFHTSFKFGGVVSVAFWSMVLVLISGVIGRYIYLQIPRSISGRELSKQELEEKRSEELLALAPVKAIKPELYHRIKSYTNPASGLWSRRRHFQRAFADFRSELAALDFDRKALKNIRKHLRQELVLQQRMDNLARMQQLFKYWHVAHRPFALIMLIVVIAHIIFTWVMGYTWIF